MAGRGYQKLPGQLLSWEPAEALDPLECGVLEFNGVANDHAGYDLRQYRYEFGRAIVFGDDFIHATEAGDAPRPLAFLCFTFAR